jgi:hypothetical protein
MFLLIPVAMIAVVAYLTAPRLDPQVVAKVLTSSDLVEKINFLIQERHRANSGGSAIWFLLAAMLVMTVMVAGGLEWVWAQVFPSNLFLFGQRKESFNRRRALLGNIFWIVAVGLVVSLVAGLIVWFVTKP